ncbi:MAG: hypothetical protein QGG36_08345 [Pirellulaceae bacterium]|nr:hypothetical protein [Pirellulaceae bacterium]
MIKTPRVAFRDPQLREATIELDHLGQPKPRSGNFATVYKATKPDGSDVAIRVFNRKGDERRERYQACSHFVAGRSLNSIIAFRFEEQGVRASDGKLYPMVVMQWVEGVTLFEWVRDRCREGYSEALAIGAEAWLRLTEELRANQIVHGDLQHGNVMVTHQGHFKLVDYDCLGVPELMGRRNLETGLPPYQHPARDANTKLSVDLDNFSALLIYTALKALAVAPQLWRDYVDAVNYDKLLFRPEDFQNPQQSQLYYALMRSPDPHVGELTRQLFTFAQSPPQNTPPMETVLLLSKSIEELLRAQDWDRVVERVRLMRYGEQASPHLQNHIATAQQRVACRLSLEQAYQRGDETELQRLYSAELLADYPAAVEIARRASEATHVRRLLEVLKSATQLSAWDMLRDTWNANEAILRDRPSAKEHLVVWRRLQDADLLVRLVSDAASDDQELIDTWRRLRQQGGHPLADQYASYVEQRVQRQAHWLQWRNAAARAPDEPTYEHDHHLVAAWTSAFFDGWPTADPERARYDAAVKRIQRFERLRQLYSTSGPEVEREIVAIATALTPVYHELVAQRAAKAESLSRTLQRVQELFAKAQTESEVLRAAEAAKRAGVGDLGAQLQRRVDLAAKRQPLLDQLASLSSSLPPAAVDQRVLEIWRPELDDCVAASRWKTIYELASRRRDTLRELEQALEAKDRDAAQRLASASCLDGFPLPANARAGLSELDREAEEQVAQHRQALINALRNNQRTTFRERFDLPLLRQICADLPHHQNIVSSWTEAEVLTQFEQVAGEGEEYGVQRQEDWRFRAEWNWPNHFATIRCRIAVCAEPPPERVDPETLDALYNVTVYRRGWEADDRGHTINANEEWAGAQVVVWGIFPLGFQTLHTKPVVLGSIEAEKTQRKWRLFKRDG